MDIDPDLLNAISSSGSDVKVDPNLINALRSPTKSKESSWFADTVDVLDAAPIEMIRDLGRAAMSVGNRVGLVDDDKYKQFETNLLAAKERDYGDWSKGKRLALGVATGVGETVGTAAVGIGSGIAGAVGKVAGMTPKLAQVTNAGLMGAPLGFLGAQTQEQEAPAAALGTLLGVGLGGLGRAKPTAVGQANFDVGVPQTLKEATGGLLARAASAVEDVLPGVSVTERKAETVKGMLTTLEDKLRPSSVGKAGSRSEQILENARVIQDDLQNSLSKLRNEKNGMYQKAVETINKNSKPTLMTGFENAMSSGRELAKQKGTSDSYRRALDKLSNQVTNEPKTALQMQQTMIQSREIADDAFRVGDMSRDEIAKLKEIAGWAEDDLGRLAEKAGAKDLWEGAQAFNRDSFSPVREFVDKVTSTSKSAAGAGTPELSNINQILKLAATPDDPNALLNAQKIIANLSPEGKKAMSFDILSRVLNNNLKSGTLNEARSVAQVKGVMDRLKLTIEDKELLEATKGMVKLAGTIQSNIGQLGKHTDILEKMMGIGKAGAALGLVGYQSKDLEVLNPETWVKPAGTIMAMVLAKSLLSTTAGQRFLVDFNKNPSKAEEFVKQGLPQLISGTISNMNLMHKDTEYPTPTELQDR
jgi:hypothetical protein